MITSMVIAAALVILTTLVILTALVMFAGVIFFMAAGFFALMGGGARTFGQDNKLTGGDGEFTRAFNGFTGEVVGVSCIRNVEDGLISFLAEVGDYNNLIVTKMTVKGNYRLWHRDLPPCEFTTAFTGGQCRILMLEVYEFLPEASILVGSPVRDGVFLKELKAAVKADFLTGVDERLAVGKSEAKHCAGICVDALTLEFRTAP